ncbi:Q-dependent dehydrogenase domain protein [Mollivirus kamchatka]|nr:Q-dependent dehydrogenase domain protein [Mollivirus kamchatka]
MHSTHRSPTLAFVLVALAVLVFLAGPAQGHRASWLNWGNGPDNTHHAAEERTISVANVGSLAPVWTRTLVGDVTGPPAVDSDGTLYINDLAGNVWSLNGATGHVKWRVMLGNYTGNPGAFNPVTGRTTGTSARGTPAISGKWIYINDIASARVFCLSKTTGALRWQTVLDSHPAAITTMSPTVADGMVFIGVSSVESVYAGFPDYPCCTFRGSMAALDARTGAIVWQRFVTTPEYPGAAVWGSSPSIDFTTRTVHVGTGNNYKVPADVQACIDANMGDARTCAFDPANMAETIIAFNMDTGAIRWNTSLSLRHGLDVWNLACKPWLLGLPGGPGPNCPAFPGPDSDFGQAPMRIYYESGSERVPLLGVGQKSGFFYALRPSNGAIVWAKAILPGGDMGGFQWGSAFDGERIYVAGSNSEFANHTTKNGQRTRGGSWAALDPATGTMLWETPVPQGLQLVNATTDEAFAEWPLAWTPLTVANGVVFAGAGSRNSSVPTMFALDAATGAILWQFAPGSAVISAPAVVNGWVYWGIGYGQNSSPGNTFYAFKVPRH